MVKCFFHGFDSLRGKKPPCWAALFVSVGGVSALHVFSRVLEIFCMSSSSSVHACCHWVGSRFSFCDKSVVRLSSCIEFSSKNFVLNCSRFSDGIGFRMWMVVLWRGVPGLASRVFCGMCR